MGPLVPLSKVVGLSPSWWTKKKEKRKKEKRMKKQTTNTAAINKKQKKQKQGMKLTCLNGAPPHCMRPYELNREVSYKKTKNKKNKK